MHRTLLRAVTRACRLRILHLNLAALPPYRCIRALVTRAAPTLLPLRGSRGLRGTCASGSHTTIPHAVLRGLRCLPPRLLPPAATACHHRTHGLLPAAQFATRSFSPAHYLVVLRIPPHAYLRCRATYLAHCLYLPLVAYTLLVRSWLPHCGLPTLPAAYCGYRLRTRLNIRCAAAPLPVLPVHLLRAHLHTHVYAHTVPPLPARTRAHTHTPHTTPGPLVTRLRCTHSRTRYLVHMRTLVHCTPPHLHVLLGCLHTRALPRTFTRGFWVTFTHGCAVATRHAHTHHCLVGSAHCRTHSCSFYHRAYAVTGCTARLRHAHWFLPRFCGPRVCGRAPRAALHGIFARSCNAALPAGSPGCTHRSLHFGCAQRACHTRGFAVAARFFHWFRRARAAVSPYCLPAVHHAYHALCLASIRFTTTTVYPLRTYAVRGLLPPPPVLLRTPHTAHVYWVYTRTHDLPVTLRLHRCCALQFAAHCGSFTVLARLQFPSHRTVTRLRYARCCLRLLVACVVAVGWLYAHTATATALRYRTRLPSCLPATRLPRTRFAHTPHAAGYCRARYRHYRCTPGSTIAHASRARFYRYIFTLYRAHLLRRCAFSRFLLRFCILPRVLPGYPARTAFWLPTPCRAPPLRLPARLVTPTVYAATFLPHALPLGRFGSAYTMPAHRHTYTLFLPRPLPPHCLHICRMVAHTGFSRIHLFAYTHAHHRADYATRLPVTRRGWLRGCSLRARGCYAAAPLPLQRTPAVAAARSVPITLLWFIHTALRLHTVTDAPGLQFAATNRVTRRPPPYAPVLIPLPHAFTTDTFLLDPTAFSLHVYLHRSAAVHLFTLHHRLRVHAPHRGLHFTAAVTHMVVRLRPFGFHAAIPFGLWILLRTYVCPPLTLTPYTTRPHLPFRYTH